ncbi:MAG: hypothetical protein ACLROH_05515 [Streptococcus sp.]
MPFVQLIYLKDAPWNKESFKEVTEAVVRNTVHQICCPALSI